ncbi:MAG: carboxylating nicotinate-nucleotide diphosphorylase [Candidatus Omnitrophica bacterium]|nr:carboxylating nicotinate-nucleotide diphosphorylase [Candidatus Omnitrophota bacterium]
MDHISKRTRFLIRKALQEDIGPGDVTTDTLIPPSLLGRAYIQAKAKGIVCGGAVVKEIFHAIDPRLKVIQKIDDRSLISKGKKIFVLQGRAASILKGERVALNFLSRLSGIATLTRQFVVQTKGTHAKIYDTRKTTPLWRELEKHAVSIGGGKNHRFGLWDEVLVKDNHWSAIRGLLEKTHCRYFSDRLKTKLVRKKVPIEVEVTGLKELPHLLGGDFRPDRVLLDNFSISNLKRTVQFFKKNHIKVSLEASGGITLANVRRIAKTGVDRISIGALTHSSPALDFSLEIV